MTTKLTTEPEFKRIADLILKSAAAEHVSINLGDSESTTLRFANNQVAQHVSTCEPTVSVRVAFGQKAGGASTNRFDDASLVDMVRRAEAIAKLAPDDPEYLSPLPPQRYTDVPSFRESTAAASPMDLAKRTKPVVDRCAAEGLQGAGIMTNTVSVSGLAASSGLFGFEQSTSAEFSLTAGADDSSGWTLNTHRDIDKLNVASRADRAIDKALKSKSPREIAAGHYPVILEPAAVAGVFGPLLWVMSAKSYYKGDSALAGKLGSTVLNTGLTLRTDPTHVDLLGSRFGGEGLASRPQTWVDKGVLKQLHYDRFTAKERGAEPNPSPSAPILSFSGPSAASIDELIAKTERGVLITNFWYIRSVDPTDLTVTGMTRDGTFLIEDGKIVAGLRNFRFHDSPLRCLANVDMATAPMEAITLERGKMLLPALKLPDFHLSSVTKF